MGRFSVRIAAIALTGVASASQAATISFTGVFSQAFSEGGGPLPYAETPTRVEGSIVFDPGARTVFGPPGSGTLDPTTGLVVPRDGSFVAGDAISLVTLVIFGDGPDPIDTGTAAGGSIFREDAFELTFFAGEEAAALGFPTLPPVLGIGPVGPLRRSLWRSGTAPTPHRRWHPCRQWRALLTSPMTSSR